MCRCPKLPDGGTSLDVCLLENEVEIQNDDVGCFEANHF